MTKLYTRPAWIPEASNFVLVLHTKATVSGIKHKGSTQFEFYKHFSAASNKQDQVAETVHSARVISYSEFEKEFLIQQVVDMIGEKTIVGDRPKQERYHTTDGEDFIDECYRTMPFEQFVGAMRFTIGKYFSRFGRKDELAKESYKIADYAQRFHEKVLLEEDKRAQEDGPAFTLDGLKSEYTKINERV